MGGIGRKKHKKTQRGTGEDYSFLGWNPDTSQFLNSCYWFSAGKSGAGAPHSTTLRVFEGAFEFAAASWSAALLRRFQLSHFVRATYPM
jgi:hypothetical protein